MKLVIQRVISGKVTTDGKIVGQVGKGYVILCGVKKGDGGDNAKRLAEKVLNLRIMPDEEMKMNKSIVEAGGDVLAISQFTLYFEIQGRRPGFTEAEEPEKAKAIFDTFVEELQKSGLNIQTGKFGHYMSIEMTNDGPVTIILED